MSVRFLSHNRLSGSLPDLTGMNVLSYLMMEHIQLQGPIPVSLFSLVQLQTV
ncbi:putative leucine-rich repeat receptor-like protein kinase, partial [Trifolium medium]|nr:putative leucine-rich repeat receptor-like protein kinase [Trifolium medium]